MTKILGLNGQPTVQSVRVPAGQLYNYHIEIESGKHTIWNVLLKKQIKAFYNQNGLALKSILEDVQKLRKEYLQFEGENIKMENNKPVLIEGKSEEELNKKWQELMSQEVNMLI